MLSGVGPQEELSQHGGIPLVHDFPGGKYLKDHPAYMDYMFELITLKKTKSLSELVRKYLNEQSSLKNEFAARPVISLTEKI